MVNNLSMKKLLSGHGEWLDANGKNGDIAISNRVRLARNVAGFVFPHRANEEDAQKIFEKVSKIILKLPYLSDTSIFSIASMPTLYRQILIERHLISPVHASSKNGSVIIGNNETISVMINEEDHLRIQVIKSGAEFYSTWQILTKIDDKLAAGLDYATSLKWGYLTACPTNIGTGLRVSIMMHLAALCFSKQINELFQAVIPLGFVIRGIHGEGTEALGELFQISNQVTLGRTEEEIIDNVERVCSQILTHELNTREVLVKKERFLTEDRVYRAYGILLNAKLISSKEAMQLLSIVRLGVGLKILDIPMKSLNELLILIQSAHLQFMVGGNKKGIPLRDIKRAELIQEKLKRK